MDSILPSGARADETSALFLVGPTACGKTALAAQIASRAGLEVISMDSMQVYRDIPIVSAQPDEEDLSKARHHLLAQIDPWEPFDTAHYVDRCSRVMEEVRGRGNACLFAGGTALYYHALTVGLSPLPGANPQLRRRLMDQADREGAGALHRLLEQTDPPTAARLHPNDVRRLVRALEICETSGCSLSSLLALPKRPLVRRFRTVGISIPREILYDRIDRRVDGMWARGLVSEIATLRLRLPKGRYPVQQAIGYRQITEYLDGSYPEEEALRLVKRDSRRFARRQIRQFQSMPGIAWLEALSFDHDDARIEEALRLFGLSAPRDQ